MPKTLQTKSKTCYGCPRMIVYGFWKITFCGKEFVYSILAESVMLTPLFFLIPPKIHHSFHHQESCFSHWSIRLGIGPRLLPNASSLTRPATLVGINQQQTRQISHTFLTQIKFPTQMKFLTQMKCPNAKPSLLIWEVTSHKTCSSIACLHNCAIFKVTHKAF